MFLTPVPGFFGAGGAVPLTTYSATLDNFTSSPSASTWGAGAFFSSDGTATYSKLLVIAPGGTATGSATWLTQTSTGAGASWWIRATPVGVTGATYYGDINADGVTWYNLSATKSFLVRNTTSGGSAQGFVTLDFSNDAGATVHTTLTSAIEFTIGYVP